MGKMYLKHLNGKKIILNKKKDDEKNYTILIDGVSQKKIYKL